MACVIPFVADPDFTLYVGDVREVLAQLPAESVDCVVTSPPYWGLRDYGTGTWEGGDADCEHTFKAGGTAKSTLQNYDNGLTDDSAEHRLAEYGYATYLQTCGSCGARRVDDQIGLERSPDCLGWATGEECGECFVCTLVDVFRQVRRVLAPHGTCWVNLGDSYASKSRGSDAGWDKSRLTNPGTQQKAQAASLRKDGQRHRGKAAGLKEKDLAGVPWRVALALQADGWWLRSDVIWSKPNVMPESTTDRPTKAHEYVFLLAKSARYFYDQDAVREPAAGSSVARAHLGTRPISARHEEMQRVGIHGASQSLRVYDRADRNLRTVWEIATQPTSAKHYATWPPKLAERCIAASCPCEVCTVCGQPRRRIVEKGEPVLQADTWSANGAASFDAESGGYELADASSTLKHVVPRVTVGWTDCGHDSYRAGVVLDPFMGSGTTALVARAAGGRHAIGIELNPAYAALCAKRLQQLTLEGTAAAVGQTTGSGSAAINGEPERAAAPSSADAEEAA